MRGSRGAVSFYLVVVCTLLATGLVAAGIVWGIERRPVTSPVAGFEAPPYVRLWYSEAGALRGFRTDGDKSWLDRWPAGFERNEPQRIQIDLPSGVLAARDARLLAHGNDGTAVAWASDGRAACQVVDNDRALQPAFAELRSDARLAALAVLDSGLFAAGYANGTVEAWDCATGDLKLRQELDIASPEEIRVAGEYIAAASGAPPAIVVHHIQPAGAWPVVEKRYRVRPTRWWLSPAGRLLVESPDGLYCGRDAVSTPGPVGSILAFGSGSRLYATGAFDGIYRLAPDESPLQVLGDPNGIEALAAASSWLVQSTADETTLYQLVGGRRLTAGGLICFVLALLALAFPTLRSLVGGLVHRSVGRMAAKRRLRERDRRHELPERIPAPIADSLAAGRLFLFAGMGLSAQSGLPRWTRFVNGLVVWAVEQRMVSQEKATELLWQAEAGDRHAVVDEIVSAAVSARGVLRRYFRDTFDIEQAASAVHRKMARVPFAAAVTTNYDHLLESSHASFSDTVLTPSSPRLWETVRSGEPFLLKLRGDFNTESEAILSPEHLSFVVQSNAALQQVISWFFTRGTVVFIGCTPPELLHDLALLGVGRKESIRHYALLAVGDSDWESQAAALEAQYGIESLPYDEEAAEEELYLFLSRLADLHESAGDVHPVRTKV